MSALRMLVPAPTLSAVLLVLWLLLARSWSPGHIVLGAVVGSRSLQRGSDCRRPGCGDRW